MNQYSLGGGFPFPIVLLPWYKLSLCHSFIKPDLLSFSGIGVFTCGLRGHVITRFASIPNTTTIGYIIYQKVEFNQSYSMQSCEAPESDIIIHEIS